jgi:hypothetical protein
LTPATGYFPRYNAHVFQRELFRLASKIPDQYTPESFKTTKMFIDKGRIRMHDTEVIANRVTLFAKASKK